MPPHCSANWTDTNSTTDSFLVRLSISGIQPCNFSLQAMEGSEVRLVHCHPDEDSTSDVVCHLKHLQPGTLYHLTVIPSGGGERRSMSARTGEVTVDIYSNGNLKCVETQSAVE